MIKKMKLCPFCGGIPGIVTYGYGDDTRWHFRRCCYLISSDHLYKTKSKAKKAWNSRTEEGN